MTAGSSDATDRRWAQRGDANGTRLTPCVIALEEIAFQACQNGGYA
jgi:hypothetical protein